MTLASGIHHHGPKQRAFGVELEGGSADNRPTIPRHDHRLHVIVDAVQRQIVPPQQVTHRGHVVTFGSLNPHSSSG
jgi:hypothetical protein